MPEISKPEITEAIYRDRMITFQLFETGTWNERQFNFNPESQPFYEKLKEAGLQTEHGLVRVNFYRDALITVRHPEDVLPEEKAVDLIWPRERTEVVGTVPGTDSQYVTGIVSGEYEFMTEAEILEAGALPDHMEQWLGRLAAESNFWDSRLDSFLPMMPGSPTSHYDLRK